MTGVSQTPGDLGQQERQARVDVTLAQSRLELVLARKAGKLPAQTEQESYSLEYGMAAVEIHRDAVEAGQRVLVVDDLLATGGTAEATGRLIRRLGGGLEGYAFMVELDFLSGREKLDSENLFSLIRYD